MHTAMLAVVLSNSLQAHAPATLETRVRAVIASSGAEVAVAFRTLDGRSELLIDPDKLFHAASTMKVPVMIELFQQARAGTLSLDDGLHIRNEFKSIVDGSTYTLSEGDDSDRDIYAAVGKTLTLRQLCDAMITVSSNFETNLLIEKLGVENIRRTVTRLGAEGMQVLRGVEDSKAFEKGLNNSTTARGLQVLFEKLSQGQAVDATSDAEMIAILKRQKFKDAIRQACRRARRSRTKRATSRASITTPESFTRRGLTSSCCLCEGSRSRRRARPSWPSYRGSCTSTVGSSSCQLSAMWNSYLVA